MLSDLRERGYKDGIKAAKKFKESNMPPKHIVNSVFANEKEMRQKFSDEFKVCWKKALKFAIIYSIHFDRGVIEGAYGE